MCVYDWGMAWNESWRLWREIKVTSSFCTKKKILQTVTRSTKYAPKEENKRASCLKTRINANPEKEKEFYNISQVTQSIDTCIICIIKFNIIATCIVIFQNKRIHIITLFICYMIDILPLIY